MVQTRRQRNAAKTDVAGKSDTPKPEPRLITKISFGAWVGDSSYPCPANILLYLKEISDTCERPWDSDKYAVALAMHIREEGARVAQGQPQDVTSALELMAKRVCDSVCIWGNEQVKEHRNRARYDSTTRREDIVPPVLRNREGFGWQPSGHLPEASRFVVDKSDLFEYLKICTDGAEFDRMVQADMQEIDRHVFDALRALNGRAHQLSV